MAAEPEIEDVANQEQMSRLDPGPHVLEKTEQGLGFRLIEVLQMDVREEIGFRSHVFQSFLTISRRRRSIEALIACSKRHWKSLRDRGGVAWGI